MNAKIAKNVFAFERNISFAGALKRANETMNNSPPDNSTLKACHSDKGRPVQGHSNIGEKTGAVHLASLSPSKH